MFKLSDDAPGSSQLMLGNEAIARGALEAGVQVCAGYPGTPSSEITGSLSSVAKSINIHVEWSANEKVATEVAAAAAFAGLRSMATMKNAGMNVASDFLQHLNISGLGRNGGAMVVVIADDPGAWYSGDEQDTRWLAKSAVVPLLVPESVHEAKDMMRWAFELSETFKVYCLLGSYTRLAHRTGVVRLGDISQPRNAVACDITELITNEAPWTLERQDDAFKRLDKIREVFESSPFNWYEGPDSPKLLVICCGNGVPCALEAIDLLKLEGSVGVLKLGTLWPIPNRLITKYLAKTKQAIILEETDPFLELHVKEVIADSKALAGKLRVYGRNSGHISRWGELTPDVVSQALSKIFERKYQSRESAYSKKAASARRMLIAREGGWCPGCPHRASFWSIKEAFRKTRRKDAFVVNDIGCYSFDMASSGGYQLTKVLHSMGGAAGVGCGFGELGKFGFKQPVITVCGDSTFYHSSVPAIVNAVYNKSNMVMIVVDNNATAMTGFQPNPGTGLSAADDLTPVVSIENICRAIGCKVAVNDPFDIKGTTDKIIEFMKDNDGVKALVLRRSCELTRMRKERKEPYRVWVDEEKCKGEKCLFCIHVFNCPSLILDRQTGKAIIGEDCPGCGVCVDICPSKAILREETVG